VNDGTQTFTRVTINSNINRALSVFAYDVDSDSLVDILSTDDQTVTLYLNYIGNAFTTQIVTSSAYEALTVVAGDVNGDSAVDIVVTEYLDNQVVLWENDGSENFPVAQALTLYDGPDAEEGTAFYGAAVAVLADLDSDGLCGNQPLSRDIATLPKYYFLGRITTDSAQKQTRAKLKAAPRRASRK